MSVNAINPDAYYGLIGSIVKTIEPETEADPIGILISLLCAIGNAVGPRPKFKVGAESHGSNIFASLVGDTASGKGQAWGVVRWIMDHADPEWVEHCVTYGLSSGEGLVDRLKDEELEPDDKEGSVQGFKVKKGATDKRLLALETEFAKPITAMRREGNTLSPLIRAAWDGQTLEVLTRGKSKLRASDTHISLLTHITREELAACFGKGTEVANGFANRILWCEVKRSRLLPHGGDISVLDPFVKPLAEAIRQAKNMGHIKRSNEANALWESVYPMLAESKPGAFGKAVERARPQVMRIALIYALIDGSNLIEIEHLRAALAVWAYCESSAKSVFEGYGDNKHTTLPPQEESEPFTSKLAKAIHATPGMTRSDMLRAFRHQNADSIEGALAWLEDEGLAHVVKEAGKTKPSERWFGGGKDLREGIISLKCDSEIIPVAGDDGKEGIIFLGTISEPKDNSFLPDSGIISESGSEIIPSFPMPLVELVAQVRAMGGKFVKEGECVFVKAPSPIPEAIRQATQAFQPELRLML
ncbi:MAG: DUF3987 domain-containing protein [Planctomycetes bacterium]|nr:DUF3987 domain-containing protein [Planctomycetota bacterium]